MKIGFFDSGLGGLTVLKAVVEMLPQYDYEFFGDTEHLPYGDKTEEEICALTKEGITHLFQKDCVLVIVACNTASAETLRTLQDTFLQEEYPDRKILGVIIPMVEEVVACGAKKAVLIGTLRTITSRKYEKEFAKFKTAPELFSLATPQLVPLIENGDIEDAVEEVSAIMEELISRNGDSLILGCTHYALLKESLAERFREQIMIFSPTEIIPKKLFAYLETHPEIETQLTKNGTRNVYLSKQSRSYDRIISEILGGHFIEE